MEVLRKCRECGLEAHTQEDLVRFKTNSKGKFGKDTICKVCSNKQSKEIAQRNPKRQVELTKKRVRDNKIRAIRYKGNKCLRCGVSYTGSNAVIFDFHHRDPKEKEMKPTKALTMSWDNIKKEIDKCDLLCSNCHRLEHRQDGGW